MKALDLLRTEELRRAVELALPMIWQAVDDLRDDEETPTPTWANIEAARSMLYDALREAAALEVSRPALHRARDTLALACVEMDAAISRGEVEP